MKKVLIMAAALSLLAAPAMASSVVDSKHNLSTSGPGTIKSTNYSEVCVFCHTPHGASLTVTGAPLWNRSKMPADFTVADMYNSATLEASSKPSANGNLANLNNSDAKLCLSCHDGTNLVDDLLNPANSSGNAQPIGLTATSLGIGNGDLLDGTNSLKNDHPVGIDYAAADGTDAELQAIATATAAGVDFFNGRLWCSSCHDVHDDEFAPFLVGTNADSALCVACHIK
ncbi:MAG: hypothetical protein NDI73_10745 [Desulfuromonadales bacterium]|nr:hypothetical protein [Desulfuromonadales bacterium]